MDVDIAYQPPPERLIKPVACFNILIKSGGTSQEGEYYRAVYLMRRTVNDLISGIAAKCNIDPIRVTRAIRINPKGLKIMMDEDAVRELPHNQDIIVELSDVGWDRSMKHEWGTSTPEIQVDRDLRITDTAVSSDVEMKFIY